VLVTVGDSSRNSNWRGPNVGLKRRTFERRSRTPQMAAQDRYTQREGAADVEADVRSSGRESMRALGAHDPEYRALLAPRLLTTGSPVLPRSPQTHRRSGVYSVRPSRQASLGLCCPVCNQRRWFRANGQQRLRQSAAGANLIVRLACMVNYWERRWAGIALISGSRFDSRPTPSCTRAGSDGP